MNTQHNTQQDEVEQELLANMRLVFEYSTQDEVAQLMSELMIEYKELF